MIDLTEAENQIISALSWFRTRYALFLNLDLERKADKKSIETFGKVWIGNFKCDWTGSFDSLVEKGILSFSQDQYQFTTKGELIRSEIESKTPFFKYEYDHFFNSEKDSSAHSEFCKRVYGIDLSQHGLIDIEELSILIDKLNILQAKNIADIGCGNGRITEYIAKKIPAEFTGFDISREGIESAIIRTKGNTSLRFKEGNLNNLAFNHKYDAILFLDTLYYADDLKSSIQASMDGLTENGHLFAYFSQWIMDVAYSENLHPTNTHLAKILTELGLSYSYTDLTISGIKHWKKKLRTLEVMKDDFVNEDNLDLWEYRYREAVRYANWGDDKYARYLYQIS